MKNNEELQRSLSHDRLGEKFDIVMNPYDIARRLEVLIGEYLRDVDLAGKHVLDAGCGTGRGTAIFAKHGAEVTSVDIGFNLLSYVSRRYQTSPVQVSVLELPFAINTFDVVFSSEVIEHTPDPLAVINEMVRVLRPGGHLVLSTPNWLWQYPVRFLSAMGLRPYDGIENFLTISQLSQKLATFDGQLVDHRGLHLLPFQVRFFRPINRWMDQFGHSLKSIMINQCIHFVKAPH